MRALLRIPIYNESPPPEPIGGGRAFSFAAWFWIFSWLICKTFSASLGLPFRLISFLISGKQFPTFWRIVLLNKLISLAVALVGQDDAA